MSKPAAPPPRPCLRPLEPFPYQEDRQSLVAWREPAGIAPMVQVPMPVAMLMSLLDGTRDLDAVARDWREASGEELPGDFVRTLVADLDEYLLLDSPRFQAARRAELEEYRASGARPAAHCPDGYPDRAEPCRSYLDSIMARADGGPVGQPSGIVAPHIDLQRGTDCYAAAYGALRASDADLFIVLGIAHGTTCWPTPPPLATLTRLDFDTPLGRVRTDRTFVDRLVDVYAAAGGAEDLFADELVHRGEHSVEFQALFLQYLFGHRPFRFVPILLGSLHEFYDRPADVAGPSGLGPLVQALRAAIEAHDGRVCIVAGADLSHIGPRFGAPRPVDAEWVASVEQEDQEALAALAESGSDAFYAHFAADGNARNVCSVSNLYVLRALLPEARFELLDHRAAFDPQQTVSFAAAALY